VDIRDNGGSSVVLMHINFCHLHVAPCGFPNKHPIFFVGSTSKCLPPVCDSDDGRLTKSPEACALLEKDSVCIKEEKASFL
jgi:hypothetical protein